MEIRVKGRTIESGSMEIGAQGENGVEEVRFIIDRFTTGTVDLSEGLAYVLFRLPDGTEGYTAVTGDYHAVDDETITLRWIVGSEVTAQPGTIDIAIRVSGLESKLWSSKPAYFTIADTLQQETPQPVTLFTRTFSAFAATRENSMDLATSMLMSANPDTEPPITVSERTINIPSELQNPAVQNDKRSEQIKIVLPRFFDGHDLSAHAIFLRTQSSGGMDDIFFDSNAKIVNASEITLLWTLEPPQTSFPGKLNIQLMVVGTGFQWSSASASVNILKLLEGSPVIPTTPQIMDQFLRDISEIRDGATQAANTAREYANVLAAAGINIKVLGFYPALSALQSAVPYPAVGDFYGIGSSPSIYAYVWNGNQWMKGHLLDPMVNSVNGQTGDVVLAATDMTAAFTEATSRVQLISGEKLSVIFGKLMKWFSSFGAAAWMNTGTTSGTVAPGDHTHTAAAVGAVPTSRKINGKALSADVTLTAGDVGAATTAAVNNAQSTANTAKTNADTALANAAAAQTTANTALANTEALNTGKLDTGGDGSNVMSAFSQASTKANIATGEKLSVIFGKLMKWYASFGAAAWMGTGTTSGTVALGNHTHTAAAVGAVPTDRKVNGKALSADVTLTASDVGARADSWLPTLAQVGGVRLNLLDNAHRSINQIGITTRSTSGYMPDRWFCYLSPNAVGHFDLLPDGNLRITKTSGDYMVVSQRFERTFWNKLIGKVVTVSVLVGADLLTASFTVAASGYQAVSLLGGIYNIGIDTLAEYGYVQLVLFANVTTPTIFPMKLELGEGQTLARKDANGNWVLIDPPPDPQQELAKCQRYYEEVKDWVIFSSTNIFGVSVPYKVNKRIVGTVTVQSVYGTNDYVSYHNGTTWVDVPVGQVLTYTSHVYVNASNSALTNCLVAFRVYADATL